MSQCVPNWDLDDGIPQHPQIQHSATAGASIHGPVLDDRVSELRWKNGSIRGSTLRAGKPLPSGVEAVVNQATHLPVPDEATALRSSSVRHHLGPWLRALGLPAPAAVDALVPSAALHPFSGEEHRPSRIVPDCPVGAAVLGGGVCSGRKRAKPGRGDGNRSTTASAASVRLAASVGVSTSASPVEVSPETENTSCGRPLTVSEGDDSCYSRRSQGMKDSSDEEEKLKNEKERPFVSTKRIRAAAVHNQSERKRRDRINQRMRTLQRLVPNSCKTDKASILDEVIDYMKQLQAQVQMMSSLSSIPHMMMPMAMQQLHMTMLAQMAQMAQMGMAMGMGMVDFGHSSIPSPAFRPLSVSGDVPGRDQLQAPGSSFPQDPLTAAFMACQTQQPVTMDAYNRMAALYQQLYRNPPGSNQGG